MVGQADNVVLFVVVDGVFAAVEQEGILFAADAPQLVIGACKRVGAAYKVVSSKLCK